jgi:hypothetical protein
MLQSMRKLTKWSWVALGVAILAHAGAAQISPPPGSTENNKDHGNIGVFLNFTRLQDQSLNLFGVGGRFGLSVHQPVMLEGEFAYDFERTQTRSITVGGLTNTVRSNVRIVHALFGPKIQTKGPLRLFLLAKTGIVNFGVGGPATAGAINNQIGTILNGDTNFAFYPGAGIEFNIKRIGIRAEAGDEIIFLRGNTTNNVRVAVGPQIRF